jgi:hypothetical protein
VFGELVLELLLFHFLVLLLGFWGSHLHSLAPAHGDFTTWDDLTTETRHDDYDLRLTITTTTYD